MKPVRHRRRRISFARVAAAVIVALAVYRILYPLPAPARFSFDPAAWYDGCRVIDGDTIELDDGTRVRLIGIDAPETKHPDRPVEPFGAEAAEFLRQTVDGRTVRLEFDRERRDRYQRVLAWVYVDDVLVNEAVVRRGLARVLTRFPFSSAMKQRLRAAESEARGAERGIWSP